MLPKEELYTPPMNIRVRDNRQFGRKPMVGVHVLKSLETFRTNPLPLEGGDEVDIPSMLPLFTVTATFQRISVKFHFLLPKYGRLQL